MRIAFFEDSLATNFTPIALLRPVFELLCGQFSARERCIRLVPVSEWGVIVRPYLAETYKEEHPEARVNDWPWLQRESVLLVNGRWLATGNGLEQLQQADESTVGIIGDDIAFILLENVEVSFLEGNFDEALAKIAVTRRPVAADGVLVQRPWDLVDHNADVLRADFARKPVPESQTPMGSHVPFTPYSSIGALGQLGHQVAVLGNPQDVFIDPSAQVDPFVVIDARQGPVSVDAGAKIQAFTRLEGPCHVGQGSQIFRANVKAGTSIGPVCRIGGEIEASIIHGYANKYHDGFLGHSYVCPWVNLGALTTNSDLKNDYSAVKVPLAGESIDSGSTKVGCFIGDHAKTAVCSLFNTGSSIGVMSMVLPGGELTPKHVPSFSRVWHGGIDDHVSLETSLHTAAIAMSRRDKELTPAQSRLLRHVHKLTAAERARACDRSHSLRVAARAHS